MNKTKALVFVSAALLSFLAIWEGDKHYTVYADQLAGGLPTVCRGITRHVTNTPIIVGETWTAEKCLAEETKALYKLQTRLLQCFNHTPPQYVFDAASSHGWNFGVESTCSSAAMQAWRRGDYETGCRRLSFADDGRRVWSFVKTGKILPNGKPEYRFIPGLANRRDDETRFCLNYGNENDNTTGY